MRITLHTFHIREELCMVYFKFKLHTLQQLKGYLSTKIIKKSQNDYLFVCYKEIHERVSIFTS